jgi:hypothetical protein
MSKESEIIGPGLAEAKKLLEYLFKEYNLESYHLSPRKLELLKMKWNYGLSNKQIAEKMSITETRVKQLYDSILYRIFSRMHSMFENSPDAETLKEEIRKLKAENEKCKKKFEALRTSDKERFNKLDIVTKSIEDVGLSSKARQAFYGTNIKTVGDLLQYRLSSLLMMKGFSIKVVEEIEKFTRKHHLKMKK